MDDQNIEQLRREAEARRQDLAADVELVADRVSPSRIADRQKAKISGRVDSIRDRVFGSPDHRREAVDDVGSVDHDEARSLSDRAGDAVSRIKDSAPGSVGELAEGNPFAAGIVGLGVGLLVATLLPESTSERQIADSVQEHVDSAAAQLARAGQEAVEPAARDGLDALKESAHDAVQTVKGEAQAAADDVRQQATDAGDAVRNES